MPKKSKYTKELLEPIVRESITLTEVLKKLGLGKTGGNRRNISSRLKNLGISTQHFVGASWAKGETASSNAAIWHNRTKNTYPDEEVFVECSTYNGGPKLTKRLIQKGWGYKCNVCGLDQWRDKPLALHLDHINGVHDDNRLENLRFLCPNCHQQTENWGNKNQRVKQAIDNQVLETHIASENGRINDCANGKKEIKVRMNKCGSPRINSRKVERPSKEDLQKLVWEKPTTHIAIDFGVSDKAVEKWCKAYDIEKPTRGYWAKQSRNHTGMQCQKESS